MSQSFFHICQSDGKEMMSFMFPPSLSTFFENDRKKNVFFHICQSDGKEMMSFMCPPSLSTFFENDRKKNVFIYNIKNIYQIFLTI